MHRRCDTCKKTKLISEYQKDKNSGKDGYRRICKICCRNHRKLIRTLTKENGPKPKRCQITGKKGKIVLDHCHDSKQFRGWILDNYNKGIGLLGDDAIGVFKSLEYLIFTVENLNDKKLVNAFNTIGRYIDNERRKSNRTTSSTS